MPANSAQAAAAGIKIPYANFTNPAVQTTRSVAQALRPFPQYGTINTTNSGGDKTGTSLYHAGVLKLTQRMSAGFLFQGSYTYSKLMTDADVFSGSTGSMDAAQPDLEYSIGRLDQTHSIKLSTVYELPFGPGRRWVTDGFASHVIGGWRIAAVQSYTSGLPIGVTTSAPLPIFNGTNRPNVTGEDWRAPMAGDEFDPLVDRFLNRAALVSRWWLRERASDQRRRAEVLEHVGERESREDDLDDRSASSGRPAGSVQHLRPRRLGRAEHRLQ